MVSRLRLENSLHLSGLSVHSSEFLCHPAHPSANQREHRRSSEVLPKCDLPIIPSVISLLHMVTRSFNKDAARLMMI